MTPSLTVRGKAYRGWRSMRITRGIEQVASTFAFEVTERFAESQATWPIREGDECVVSLGDTTLLRGFVDSRQVSFSASEHSVRVDGRDRCGALVDCSAVPSRWEFRNVDLLAFATELTVPFGVTVSAAPGLALPRVERFSVEPGDTVHNVLEQACRSAGVLLVGDGLGGLTLAQAGSARARAQLVEGKNLLSASASFDYAGRFARYRVLGSHAGSENLNGSAASAVSGEARDENITRAERVLLVRPEGNVTREQAKRRAEWEATTRAARGDSVEVVVGGWAQGDGLPLWPVNALVRLDSPSLGVSGDLLISQVTHELTIDGGEVTRLALRRPDAWLPRPTVSAQKQALWKEIARGV